MRQSRMLRPQDVIWAVYNHMPGGHIVATHFETVTRRRKRGDDMTEDVIFTAESQFTAFAKSDFVALNAGGKLERNKMFRCQKVDPTGKNPAGEAIAEAQAAGITALPAPETPKAAIEGRVDRLENAVERLVTTFERVLARFAVSGDSSVAGEDVKKKA